MYIHFTRILNIYLNINAAIKQKIISRKNDFKCIIFLNKSASLYQLQHSHYKATWSVLFFGTDDFACTSLHQLHNHLKCNNLISRLEVVSSHNPPKENAIISFTNKHNIKMHSWPIEFPISQFDIGIVVSFGYLIPRWIIESFPLGMINVHASLLPRWRGASPIVHSLIHGDKITGITIMKIEPNKFDTGDILAQKSIDIDPHDCLPQLNNKLAYIGSELLIETIKNLPNIINTGISQPTENVTYAPKISQKIANIDWDKMNAVDIYNLHRALIGLYPLTTYFDGEKIKLLDIECYNETSFNSSEIIKPGLVSYDKKNNAIIVQCRDGKWVLVKRISMIQRRKMTANDFYNGFINNVRKKQILFTNKI